MCKVLKLFFIFFVFFNQSTASAFEIQKVVSPNGITAWLVEDHNLPLLALNVAFEKNPDPKKYTGSSEMLARLLDQGAGNLNWAQFQGRLEKLSIHMNFYTGLDTLYGSLRTLTKNKKQAFELFALALQQPNFENEAIERVRSQLLSISSARQQSLPSFAREKWYRIAFGTNPYAYPANGIASDIKKINRKILRARHKRIITRGNLSISVVGDITAKELAQLLDETFAPLPEGKKVNPASKKFNFVKNPPHLTHVKKPSAQSIIYFGLKGLRRDDPNFITYYVMNHILGSGNNSRLFKIARERFGLVYSIYTSPIINRHNGFILGSAATSNNKKDKLLRLIRKIFAYTRKKGVSKKELAEAKSFLIGNYGINFDSSIAIAENLTFIQRNKLGIDYIKRRETLINEVKLTDVNHQIRKILDYDRMIILTTGGGNK